MTIPRIRFGAVLMLALAASVPMFGADGSSGEKEEWWSGSVRETLVKAGTNQLEMAKALKETPSPRREGMAFLLENMSSRDLQTLSGEYLLENLTLAYEAWETAPWHRSVPKEIFLNEILPHAVINETREEWRKRLRELALPLVANCKTPSEAAIQLNEKIFPLVKVKYSTERKKANQSPFESIDTGLASCTGLSILLVDACRAVGVPARLVGIPNWVDKRGNHTWVEIWDGQWHFTGAAEPDPNGLNRGWFTHDASLAQKETKEHAIYATSFRRTELPFPMVWARNQDYISAVNVTDRYTAKYQTVEPGHTRLLVKVMEYPGGKRVPATVTLAEEGSDIKMEGTSKDERFDTNDILAFPVTADKSLTITAIFAGKSVNKEHRIGSASQEIVAIYLDDHAPASLVAKACTFPRSGVKALPNSEKSKVESSFNQFFASSAEDQEGWKSDSALDDLLSRNEAAVRLAAWEAYKRAPVHKPLRDDFENKMVRFENHQSPYTIKTVGTMPATGWPLFIAMHGGGGAPQEVNDRQWRVMQNYYKDQDSVPGYLYVALRAPNNTWNGFYDTYVYPLIHNLTQQFLLFGDVDPNKVFIIGYSHGGYGAFAIGPKMPDHFAAIHSSAAAPTDGETSAKTLRNTVFTYMLGEKDLAYGRLERCQRFDALIKQLRGDRTDIYPVTFDLKLGYPHSGLPDKDMIKAMYPAVRNPAPRELTWEMTDSVIQNFFWLHVPAPEKGQQLDATCVNNKIVVNGTNVKKAEVLLDSRLVDFTKPIVLEVNGRSETYHLKPSAAILCQTLLQRGDPDLAFTAKLPIHF